MPLSKERTDVPISWKDRVAQIFVRSALFAGILDDKGFLRYDAAMHSKQLENQQVAPEAAQESPLRPLAKSLSESPLAQAATVGTPGAGVLSRGVSPSEATFVSGKVVWASGQIRVETPEDISPELWAKLNAYVQGVLKPVKNE